jgi:hypothetical protein
MFNAEPMLLCSGSYSEAYKLLVGSSEVKQADGHNSHYALILSTLHTN